MSMRLGTWAVFALCLLATAVHAEAVQERVLSVPGPEGALQGTWLSPAEGAAARATVLIIPGSGPTNRDGNNPQGIRAAPYRLLAEGLAQQDIASVRIDKRGMFGSAAAWSNANDVTLDDYAHDVAQWVTAIREQAKVECVWVLGHSEGGLVALLAAQDGEGLCGVILLATPGRPMGQVLREQLNANPANRPLLRQAFQAIAKLENGDRVDVTELHQALRPLFATENQKFLISSFALDPVRLAATAQVPMLILQGERDIQVSVADARRLHSAAPDAKRVVLPAVNHVLKEVDSDDRSDNIATYGHADLPLAPGVVAAIADFIFAER